MITHVVIFWTDKPHSQNRASLLAGARMLGQIPGVLEFRCGIPVPGTRAVLDDSFAVAISMTFKNQADADAYQVHPIHLEFVETCCKPYAKRLVVYDWES